MPIWPDDWPSEHQIDLVYGSLLCGAAIWILILCLIGLALDKLDRGETS